MSGKRQEGGERMQRDGVEKGRRRGARNLSKDERIETREDGKPNQFSLAVIPIRRQS